MNKLAAVAAGSAALATIGILCAGQATSDTSTLDVSGNTYAQAVKILRSQGYKAVFQGSVGSDVPQPQCIVESQKILPRGRVSLMLNCTRAAQPDPSELDPNAPVVGSNGVTTVKATPVAPAPQELGPQPPPLMPEGG